MEPTMKATEIHACSCKPSTTKRCTHRIKKVIFFKLRLIALTGLFIVSTSYQSHKNELLLLENNLFLPAFSDDLSVFFQRFPKNDRHPSGRSDLQTMPLIKEFYATREYKPVWTYNATISDEAAIMLDLLDRAERFGFESKLFHAGAIRQELAVMKNKDLPMKYMESRRNFELMLTDACLKFLVYLKMGYHKFDSSLFSLQAVADLPVYLNSLLKGNDFENSILSVQPTFVEYQRLQKGLDRFLTNVERNDTRFSIPDPLKDPDLFREVAGKILTNIGYLNSVSSDTAFLQALKKFQYYHGLEPDGKADKNTCKALAQSTEEKFRLIALNLDRLRKETLQTDHLIYVNIPAYQVRIYKMNRRIGNARVIVGKVKTPTPLIDSKIEKIITNPYWQVPRSITLNEMLPKLKSDSGYLTRNRLQLMDENRNPVAYNQVDWNAVSTENFDLKLRQDAGKNNSLGRVKFVFPSPYSIYLHDTPGKNVFSNNFRALSHGCVRLQHPEMLAEYLVRECTVQDNDLDITSLINKGIHCEISLNNPVDLHIHYLTCEADEDYNIFFYQDVYGFDKKDLKRLESLQ
ncbi:MAG: L,D-transpeptidase family protein [Bacteroidales bacterium]|nr:L,D-transpeptidase family protein [Bacteroidales bacterium]